MNTLTFSVLSPELLPQWKWIWLSMWKWFLVCIYVWFSMGVIFGVTIREALFSGWWEHLSKWVLMSTESHITRYTPNTPHLFATSYQGYSVTVERTWRSIGKTIAKILHLGDCSILAPHPILMLQKRSQKTFDNHKLIV